MSDILLTVGARASPSHAQAPFARSPLLPPGTPRLARVGARGRVMRVLGPQRPRSGGSSRRADVFSGSRLTSPKAPRVSKSGRAWACPGGCPHSSGKLKAASPARPHAPEDATLLPCGPCRMQRGRAEFQHSRELCLKGAACQPVRAEPLLASAVKRVVSSRNSSGAAEITVGKLSWWLTCRL